MLKRRGSGKGFRAETAPLQAREIKTHGERSNGVTVQSVGGGGGNGGASVQTTVGDAGSLWIAIGGKAGDGGKSLTDCVPMRSDLRGLANHGRVDVRDHAAARAHGFHRRVQKDGGGGTLPLRVARRKMATDVAVAEGAVERVGDGMAQDVCIRVANQTFGVRHL